MKTLVVGCDASGKSTLLDSVRATYGDTFAESTRSEEASRFRNANFKRVIDGEFISQRENLYLKLSQLALINERGLPGNIITSDSSLVTRLSHSTMRQVICEPYLNNSSVIKAWQEDQKRAGSETPDIFALTHADSLVITERMRKRQITDNHEQFWGFNSPLFLEVYQERWRQVITELSNASLTCISLNTGTLSINECLEHYVDVRKTKVLQ